MNPQNIPDALRLLHELTSAIGWDLEAYLENPGKFAPEYFESIKDAAHDANLLVTWIKDRINQ